MNLSCVRCFRWSYVFSSGNGRVSVAQLFSWLVLWPLYGNVGFRRRSSSPTSDDLVLVCCEPRKFVWQAFSFHRLLFARWVALLDRSELTLFITEGGQYISMPMVLLSGVPCSFSRPSTT